MMQTLIIVFVDNVLDHSTFCLCHVIRMSITLELSVKPGLLWKHVPQYKKKKKKNVTIDYD